MKLLETNIKLSFLCLIRQQIKEKEILLVRKLLEI